MRAPARVARQARAVLLAVAALTAGLTSFAVALPAHAEEPPSADRLKAAAEEYDRGRRAFLGDDFEGAAVHFENAFRDAPRAETVRLAIRARRKAKQLARAATLAAVAQQRYPNDAPTAQLSKETLDEVGPSLHEYLVECNADCAVAADGRVVSQSDAQKHRIFLEPGSHELGVSFKQGAVMKPIDARRGGRETLTFEAPPAKIETPRAGGGSGATAEPGGALAGKSGSGAGSDSNGSGKPLRPVVFLVGAGLTVALGAATIVSGIDATNNPGVDAVRRACAGRDESCPEYQDGKSAETRTNVLLGVTIGAAVVTGVIGLFFTRWAGSASPAAAQSGSFVSFGAAPLPGGASAGAFGRF